MLVATCDQVSAPRDNMAPADGDAKLRHTIDVLEQLFAQSICLRDLYRNARWQTVDIQYRPLRKLFDRHYKQQLHLIDVLIDRIRTLGGGRTIFASNFLQSTKFAPPLRGNKAAGDLLNGLLDAHESVLFTGRLNGSAMNAQWEPDFAVGQVVLTNGAQSLLISEQLVACEPRQRFLRQHAGATLDSE